MPVRASSSVRLLLEISLMPFCLLVYESQLNSKLLLTAINNATDAPKSSNNGIFQRFGKRNERFIVRFVCPNVKYSLLNDKNTRHYFSYLSVQKAEAVWNNFTAIANAHKPTKPRTEQYDEKLTVTGSFMDVIKAAAKGFSSDSVKDVSVTLVMFV